MGGDAEKDGGTTTFSLVNSSGENLTPILECLGGKGAYRVETNPSSSGYGGNGSCGGGGGQISFTNDQGQPITLPGKGGNGSLPSCFSGGLGIPCNGEDGSFVKAGNGGNPDLVTNPNINNSKGGVFGPFNINSFGGKIPRGGGGGGGGGQGGGSGGGDTSGRGENAIENSGAGGGGASAIDCNISEYAFGTCGGGKGGSGYVLLYYR